MMFWTCFLTVSSAIESLPPISLLVMPSASRRSTSSSRGVSENCSIRARVDWAGGGTAGALSASRRSPGSIASWPSPTAASVLRTSPVVASLSR